MVLSQAISASNISVRTKAVHLLEPLNHPRRPPCETVNSCPVGTKANNTNWPRIVCIFPVVLFERRTGCYGAKELCSMLSGAPAGL